MLTELVQEIKNTISQMLNDVHTAMPGIIMSFEASTGLAVVQPKIKYRMPNGSLIDYPPISGVPVIIPQCSGQKATIAFPIAEGDGCLLVISEKSIDYWLYGQETDTELSFDITNAIAIPGLFSSPNEVLKDACNKSAVIIARQDKQIEVSQNGIKIVGDVEIMGDVKISGDITNQGNVQSQGNINASGSISTASGTIEDDGTLRVPKAVIESSLVLDTVEMSTHRHLYGEDREKTSEPVKE